MTGSTLDFIELTSQHQAELECLIAIYQEAIEPSEQKTSQEIQSMLNNPRYAMLVARDNGAVSGFAILFFPSDADYWLLEYMAVAAPSRGRRIGETIFFECYRRALKRSSSAAMLLEVDQPGSSSNRLNDTAARFRFYRRMQCRVVDRLDYLLPLETANAPPAMMLLTYGSPPATSIEKHRVELWLRSLYRDVYGKQVDDPRIACMLEPLSDRVALRPL